MGGMKTGAGEDPFADDAEDDGAEEEIPRRNEERSRASETTGRDSDDRRSPDREQGGSTGGERVEATELPFIARRNARGDNVKVGREKRRLFELRPAVAEKEASFMEDLEAELGTGVPKTDAREAALAVVYERPELVAARLEEWGINYFEDG